MSLHPRAPRIVIADGGRAEAGFVGAAGDCVTCAIAIASGLPYRQVYDRLNELARRERPRGRRQRSSARNGVKRSTYKRLLVDELGATWVSCMSIGSGCTVHLRADELPGGRLVTKVSKHLVAVIDGVVYDTYDPSRGGTRCVYGYYVLPIGAVSDASRGASAVVDPCPSPSDPGQGA